MQRRRDRDHPLDTTGLAQCFERVSQRCDRAERRQDEGAFIAVAHDFRGGGAGVATA